jgi:hypothetical protein
MSFNLIKRAAGDAQATLLGIEKAVAIKGSCEIQIAALGEPADPLFLSDFRHDGHPVRSLLPPR